MAAVLNIVDLVLGDDPADDGSLPVIIGANQSPIAIVQFQCRISQRIWNTILTELGANGADNHSLWSASLHDETANQHVVARLHKGARDRKSTRLNSSHVAISYAVFRLKQK